MFSGINLDNAFLGFSPHLLEWTAVSDGGIQSDMTMSDTIFWEGIDSEMSITVPQTPIDATILQGHDKMLPTTSTVTPEQNKYSRQLTKGCKCKRSRCLKRYCECYGEGVMCGAACGCVGCENATRTQHKLKQRDRCACKKTRCLKKYCECFANGNLCGDRCSCITCENHETRVAVWQNSRKRLKL